MNKKCRQEYKDKLRYISEHSRCVDYDWFDKDGLIIWIDNLQPKKKIYYVGYFAMDRDGKFYLLTDEGIDSWDQENCRVITTQRREYDKLPDDVHTDWLFKYVSTNAMLWKVNKIYDELKLLESCTN